MARYDVVLLDADRTLLDFERSERAALRRALAKWGLPQDDQVCDTYSKINDALWASFARGEIDQDFLVVERFAALLRLYGAPDSPEPARLNRDYAEFWARRPSAAWGGRVLPDAGGDGADTGHRHQRPARPQRGRYVRTGLNKLVPNLFISMEVGAPEAPAGVL